MCHSGWGEIRVRVCTLRYAPGHRPGATNFLLHINDLPQSVRSSVRLFADDYPLYKTISSIDDTLILQRDLDSLKEWGSRWGMRFNVSKCNIMRLAWSRQPITKFYTLGNKIIEELNQVKYSRVTSTSELNWSTHIDVTTNKANSTLGFLMRDLIYCPRSLKELSYMSLVNSKLEYCALTSGTPTLPKTVTNKSG